MTRSQLAVIKIAKKKLGLDDYTYRAVLRQHGGVESAKDLDARGFTAVMDHFKRCGFRSHWHERTYGDGRPGMATPAQVDAIRARWFDYTGRNDEAALNKWLERSYGIAALRFLDQDRASKALNGLKMMVARKGKSGDPANSTPAA